MIGAGCVGIVPSKGFLFGKFLLGFVFVLGLAFSIGRDCVGNKFCEGGHCGRVGNLCWMGAGLGGVLTLAE